MYSEANTKRTHDLNYYGTLTSNDPFYLGGTRHNVAVYSEATTKENS